MSLLDYLRGLFSSEDESSEPEHDTLPSELGPSARQHAFTGTLPERYEDVADDSVDLYVAVNTDLPNGMDEVESLLSDLNMNPLGQDEENGVITIQNVPENPNALVRLAKSDYVDRIYYAREWSNE